MQWVWGRTGLYSLCLIDRGCSLGWGCLGGRGREGLSGPDLGSWSPEWPSLPCRVCPITTLTLVAELWGKLCQPSPSDNRVHRDWAQGSPLLTSESKRAVLPAEDLLVGGNQCALTLTQLDWIGDCLSVARSPRVGLEELGCWSLGTFEACNHKLSFTWWEAAKFSP